MKNQTFIFTIFFSLFFISCNMTLDELLNGQSDYELMQDINNGNGSGINGESFVGTWKGSYSGGESGNITISVYKSNICCIKTENIYGETREFWSEIYSNGTFKNEGDIFQQIYLFGSLDRKTKKGSGTWKYVTMSGNWQVSKQ